MSSSECILPSSGLDSLITLLRHQGRTVVGPQINNGAIVYDELQSVSDLPAGWTDQQDNGSYQLTRRDDNALFAYNVGPHSWKRFLHPERLRLWQAQRSDNGINVIENTESVPKYAFIGVRSCELHAIAIQDTVFLEGAFKDQDYALRRDNTIIIAVNCTQAGGTCFCASMGSGPGVSTGFDIALTELVECGEHRFLVQIGSDVGATLIAELKTDVAQESDLTAAEDLTARACSQMGRQLDTRDIKALLQRNPEHPQWDLIASRCLSCANCTMVCPTCFCSSTEDVTDLTGDHAERWRRWDSCFTMDFSYIHGGSVRQSTKSHYRQWMTHKLANWFDQFGSSGCVGCGRCITWCPVGIDITAEVAAIRATDPGGADNTSTHREKLGAS